MVKHCAYGLCGNDSRYHLKWSNSNLEFLPFPKPCKLYQQQRMKELSGIRVDKRHVISTCSICMKASRWANLCKREGFGIDDIRKDTYICSAHFVGGNGPTPDYPDPVPANTSSTSSRLVTRKRPMQRSATPAKRSNDGKSEDCKLCSEFNRREMLNVQVQLPVTVAQKQENPQTISKQSATITAVSTTPKHKTTEGQPEDKIKVFEEQEINSKKIQTESPTMVTSEVQTTSACSAEAMSQTEIGQMTSVSLQTEKDTQLLTLRRKVKTQQTYITKLRGDLTNTAQFSFELVKDNNDMMFFYTGLSLSQFMCLFNFLGKSVQNLTYWKKPIKYPELSPTKRRGPKRILSPLNELFLTLVRLRTGLLVQDMAYRFKISTSQVTTIFITWIQFMYLQFGRLRKEMFATRQTVSRNLPKAFKKFKNIRVIIDCTEFFCQVARDFHQQGNLYSSYKNHCTFKVLIGVAPNGTITFVSDAYEGSISDKDIVKKSGFLDFLEEGDLVLADKDFTIRDLLNEKKVGLNIPPFLGKRDKLSAQEEVDCKQIARARIHVERANRRVKEFRLLQKIIPLNLVPIFSQLVFVSCCLVNFQEPLVK